MRARTTTVLGLILLLAAPPAEATGPAPPSPAPLRVFVATTSLRSPVHRSLVARHGTPPRAAAESQSFLAVVRPLFGRELARGPGDAPLLATYVPAAAMGSLRPIAIGTGKLLAWSPYGAPPARDLLDLLMARQPMPALIPADDGLRPADLRITARDPFGAGGVFVTAMQVRGRNTPGDELRIEPPALAVVGLCVLCLAPAPRRARASPRLQPMRRLRFFPALTAQASAASASIASAPSARRTHSAAWSPMARPHTAKEAVSNTGLAARKRNAASRRPVLSRASSTSSVASSGPCTTSPG